MLGVASANRRFESNETGCQQKLLYHGFTWFHYVTFLCGYFSIVPKRDQDNHLLRPLQTGAPAQLRSSSCAIARARNVLPRQDQ